MSDISGFLIVLPMILRLSLAYYLIYGLVFYSSSLNLGTITGRQLDSCLGEQYAILPNAHILPILDL